MSKYNIYKGLDLIKPAVTADEMIEHKLSNTGFTYRKIEQKKWSEKINDKDEFIRNMNLAQRNDLHLGLRVIKYSEEIGEDGKIIGWHLRSTTKGRSEKEIHLSPSVIKETKLKDILYFLSEYSGYIYDKFELQDYFDLIPREEFVNIVKSLR